MTAELITSRQNPRIRHWHLLATTARARRESGQTLLDGAHLIAAALDARAPIECLIINELRAEHPEIAALRRRAAHLPHTLVTDALFRHLSPVEHPTGILALLPIPQASADPTAQPPAPTTVILEAIQDPGNLGTLLRTAAAAGIHHVHCTPGCAQLWSPKVLRAAMGAHFHLPRLTENADPAPLLDRHPGPILATTLSPGARSLWHTDLTARPLVWLFGNEGTGLTPTLAARATHPVTIPMPGGIESLNVAAAAAVCLFEMVRSNTATTPSQTLHDTL